MKIPVFVSSPTSLNSSQEKARIKIFNILGSMNLEPRALGQSDYPTQLPLREVYTIARLLNSIQNFTGLGVKLH
ncbi:MAG: hypothetical protein GY744_08860 [Gammaproteobacteria bacterium]|nr:hypothetical protein [Gammaproteobacteria bacterium]